MKLLVKEVAQAKGIQNAQQLSELAGVPLASMYRIWNGKARMVGLETMERLCKALKVQPGLLLMHIDTEALEAQPKPDAMSQKRPKAGSKK